PTSRINRRGAPVVQFYEIILISCAAVTPTAIHLADQDWAGARRLCRRTVARRVRTGGSLVIRRGVTSAAGTIGTTPDRAGRTSFVDLRLAWVEQNQKSCIVRLPVVVDYR